MRAFLFMWMKNQSGLDRCIVLEYAIYSYPTLTNWKEGYYVP